MSTGALPADRSAPGRAAPAAADPSAAAVASARRGVLAYLLSVIVLSAGVQAAILVTREMALILVLMWMPALASILVRLVRRKASPMSPSASADTALGSLSSWPCSCRSPSASWPTA